MPKNAVEKLQEIENDIKTVISLYEVANKSKNNNNDKPKATKKQNTLQFSKICSPKCLEASQRHDQFGALSGQTQASLFDSFKKTCGFLARSSERHDSREPLLGKKWYGTKPGSAPSSSSTLTTICESDTRQRSSDVDCGLEKAVLSKAKTSDNLKSSEWFDPNDFPTYDVVMSPSKTIETAKEILEKNKFKEKTGQPFKLFEKVLSPAEMGIKEHPNALKQTPIRPLNPTARSSYSPQKKNSTLQKPNASSSTERSRSISPRNQTLKDHPATAPAKSKMAVNAARTKSKEKLSDSHNDAGREDIKSEDTEAWVDELSKVIEKNNQKLEKMKLSKELALDIAKHFKEKYDQIQKSKDELLTKLQKVEKNKDKKMTAEIKVGTDKSSDKLHHEPTAEDPQTKMIKEENAFLKSKLYEVEAIYNAQLLEKKNEIEEIEMERLVENRNGLKSREILERKIQLLTSEKNELFSKFDELRRQLYDSQSKTRALEENICQLEQEVIKQKQHLRIKTETLHGTNRELEMIRLNSTDLEEQVKTLRKSIEEFDGIQQSLLRQTTEYEQQIKANQEKIKALQDENVRLKEDLENEKDGLLIKVKIIEDQQQTIRQLKEKSEDAKTLLKKNQSLERVLNMEREEKLELQDALQRLKWRKDQLKKRIKTLENDVLLAPQEVVKDLQKTQKVLRELESQVQMKQREWESQLHTLFKEKEQACSVAEFATKKLMETTNELQKQSDAYKGLQRMIAGNWAVKDRHHHEPQKKVQDVRTL